MLAVAALSGGAQFAVYLAAFILFVVAAVVAWVQAPHLVWATCVAAGLALATFVLMWNALALS